MLTPRSALLLFLSIQAASVREGPGAQSSTPETSRTLKVGGDHGQPTYALHIFAEGGLGTIDVRDSSGSPVQTLNCSLLRDETAPTAPELEAIRRQFVSNFLLEDLNFDGYLDLKAPREFGAQWVRYCVWLFDPKDHLFVKDTLAEQMELLYDLEADAKHQRVTAHSIGFLNPLRDEYRIERVGADRPYWPRLIPTESCFVDNASPATAAVVTEYDQGRPAVKRQPADAHAVCSSGCECSQPAGQR